MKNICSIPIPVVYFLSMNILLIAPYADLMDQATQVVGSLPYEVRIVEGEPAYRASHCAAGAERTIHPGCNFPGRDSDPAQKTSESSSVRD